MRKAPGARRHEHESVNRMRGGDDLRGSAPFATAPMPDNRPAPYNRRPPRDGESPGPAGDSPAGRTDLSMTAFVESCLQTVAGSAVAAERRARGRPRAAKLLEVLAGKKNILVTAHVHPDPDALASAFALAALIRQVGGTLVSPGGRDKSRPYKPNVTVSMK